MPRMRCPTGTATATATVVVVSLLSVCMSSLVATKPREVDLWTMCLNISPSPHLFAKSNLL